MEFVTKEKICSRWFLRKWNIKYLPIKCTTLNTISEIKSSIVKEIPLTQWTISSGLKCMSQEGMKL